MINNRNRINQGSRNRKHFIWLYFITFSLISLSFTTEKMINPYSWLYNNNGLLMADTSIHIDTNLAKCFTSEIVGASRYLQNKTILLNELNYPPVAYESGYQNNLILELTLEKFDSHNYQIIKIEWIGIDYSFDINKKILEYYRNSLIGIKLYHTCDCGQFVLHLPIKLFFEPIASNDFGITKGFENNWFFIHLKNHGVIDM